MATHWATWFTQQWQQQTQSQRQQRRERQSWSWPRPAPALILVAVALALLPALSGCTGEPGEPAAQGESSPKATASGKDEALTVGAAASLQFAFKEIGKAFEAETGQKVVFLFSSSGNLAQQIESGAPIDLFASANLAFVDQLQAKGLLLPESRQVYAVGKLVLASSQKAGVQVESLQDLLRSDVKRVAIADPEHAPYGAAARTALQNAGLWEQVEPKLVYGATIRQALQFVETGNAEAGLVALSIADVPQVSHVPVPDDLYEPLRQELAVVKGAAHEQAAREFAAHVTGPQGRAILQQYGFGVPEND